MTLPRNLTDCPLRSGVQRQFERAVIGQTDFSRGKVSVCLSGRSALELKTHFSFRKWAGQLLACCYGIHAGASKLTTKPGVISFGLTSLGFELMVFKSGFGFGDLLLCRRCHPSCMGSATHYMDMSCNYNLVPAWGTWCSSHMRGVG